jgi:hypothetical protein
MNATQELPPTYQAVETIDVSTNRRLLVLLNVAGLVIVLVAAWAFLAIAAGLRAQELTVSLAWLTGRTEELAVSLGRLIGRTPARMLIAAGGIIFLSAGYIIVHEAFHGIFFWLFTRSRPKFAFRGAYAYAAAPGWYIRRNAYLLTALAPLVFMSLIGLLIIAFAPPAWIFPTWMVVMFNAGGATGDLWVAIRLLRRPARTYICDRGDAVSFFL